MHVITGNLLDVRRGVLGHQVNCRGKLGAGLGLQVRQRFPQAAHAYFAKTDWKLGDVLFCEVDPRLFIAHLAGQRDYGRGRRYTNYEALGEALGKAAIFATEHELSLCLPFGLGCGLAGGRWETVSVLIEKVCPEAVVYQLERNVYNNE